MRVASFYRDPAWRLELQRGLRTALPAAPGAAADRGRSAFLGRRAGGVRHQPAFRDLQRFATALVRDEGAFAHRDAWFLGACGFNWLVWQVTSIAGILAATAIPGEWGLQFAGTLALLALAIPLCLEWPGLAGAAVAAPIAILLRGLPFGLGLFAGILAGIAAAVAVDALIARRKPTAQREEGEPS